MSKEKLLELVIRANRLGHLGYRITDVIYQPAQAATDKDNYILQMDEGPISATEDW